MTTLEKRKILAILGQNLDLVGTATAKLYTCSKDGENWLQSNLEGILCLIIDYTKCTRYFVMFDSFSFEKLFQFELYCSFNKFYEQLREDFYSFEVNNGFVGFKFFEVKEAEMFNLVVNKFDDNLIKTLCDVNKNNKMTHKIKKEMAVKTDSYCKILKEKFASEDKKYDKSYQEDGLEIIKPRHFEMMNNITFDRERKEFVIGVIPEDLKKLFRQCGLKKKDLKDTKFALSLFKHFIEGIDVLDNEKKMKFQDSYATYNPRSKELLDIDLEISKEEQKQSTPKEDYKNITAITKEPTTAIPKVPNIPSVPAVPKVPHVPLVPKIETKKDVAKEADDMISKIKISESIVETPTVRFNEPVKQPSNTGVSMHDEIKNVTLKKIEQRKTIIKPTKISNHESSYLQKSLQEAIKQRRADLTKNDIESDSGSDSEWSD